jgi:hypothetical protein
VIWFLGFESLEIGLELFEFHGWEKVNFKVCGGGVPMIADLTGYSECAWAGDSVVGKKEVALPSGDFFVVDPGFENDVSEGDAGFDGLPFQPDFHGSKGGADGDDGVTEGFGPGESIARGAGTRVAGAARAENDVLGGNEVSLGTNCGNSSPGGEDFGDGGVEFDLDPGFV